MKTPIVGIFRKEQHVFDVIEELKAIGWNEEDLSVISRSREVVRQVDVVTGTNGAEGMAAGAVTGAVLGGTVGILATTGLLLIPGIGPLLAAGPAAVFLAGAAVGGSTGTLVGGLVGLGIPETEAENYRLMIENDHYLVIASVTEAERSSVERIFLAYGSLQDGTSSTAALESAAKRHAPDDIRVVIGTKASEYTLDSLAPVQEFIVHPSVGGEEG
ncbi:general stress protein [Paenibacillus sacheonensis]|uniref:Low temperature-induced protein n=1 Tax=Paenibacillus sacheonensis TaxID=742054 RepID=A0A7X5BY63_9BACL|nr:general stress protein [Paenibacillus sacheonensis]MBM7564798.1 hypothetical protein [Paenibacillus sacheonensis]NBC69347.1 low temperature-induced protein [Paenibacillus sacheonensis]